MDFLLRKRCNLALKFVLVIVVINLYMQLSSTKKSMMPKSITFFPFVLSTTIYTIELYATMSFQIASTHILLYCQIILGPIELSTTTI